MYLDKIDNIHFKSTQEIFRESRPLRGARTLLFDLPVEEVVRQGVDTDQGFSFLVTGTLDSNHENPGETCS